MFPSYDNIVEEMPADSITSAANPLLKEIRKAQEQGGLTSHGWLIAEGPHLVEEAARSGLRIRCAVVAEGKSLPPFLRADRTIEVPDRVFRSVAGTETPQGLMVLTDPPDHTIESLFLGTPLIIVLDGIQDPGNAGTIARACEAFGATGMVFTNGAVNPLHPKTLRASAGSLFRLPFVRIPVGELAGMLGGRTQFFAALPFRSQAPAVWDCDLKQPCTLIVGSEGRGIDGRLLALARPFAVPTERVESLNAAVAASVILYECARQRMEGLDVAV